MAALTVKITPLIAAWTAGQLLLPSRRYGQVQHTSHSDAGSFGLDAEVSGTFAAVSRVEGSVTSNRRG